MCALQVHINDNFAKFSEALFVADRHAREEVRQRALMQQKLAQKEKEAKRTLLGTLGLYTIKFEGRLFTHKNHSS